MISQIIREKAEKLRQYSIDFRRDLHMHPEPSREEYRTSRRIQEELARHDIPFVVMGQTGVLATVDGAKPGRTILLRGDMDALSVQEETGLPFASQVDGMMHACGHDCHTTILLTSAIILNEMKDSLAGQVRFAFQPAEEVSWGARMMVENGALEGVDACFGAHVMNNMPYGEIGFCSGNLCSAAGVFEILVQGRSGHGALPHLSVDSVVVAAAVVSALQTVVSREIDPMLPSVLTVGDISGGTRFNVIADSVRMTGTFRTFDPEIEQRMPEMIERVATHTAAAYRAEAQVTCQCLCNIVTNDPDMLALARRSSDRVLGPQAAVSIPSQTGSEDFSEFSMRRPSAFVFIGSAIPGEEAFNNHHGRFCVDERVLADGAALYAQVAADFLLGEGEDAASQQ